MYNPVGKTPPELAAIALEIRKDILLSLSEAGSGHTGGSLGMADVFTVLYFNVLRHDPENPDWDERDRLILSIGHIAPVLYTALAHAGYFPKEELMTLRKLGSRLQGHPSRDFALPGIEISSGSLGQGLSVSVGLALAAKMDAREWKVYCVLGDGELQEGSVWEAAMSASYHKLNNLIAIVDRNGCQIDGRTTAVMEIEPLIDKWIAFGWEVININGHNFDELLLAFRQANTDNGKPTVILANTTMGKGVKSIEDNYQWHGKVPAPDQARLFIQELSDNQDHLSIQETNHGD